MNLVKGHHQPQFISSILKNIDHKKSFAMSRMHYTWCMVALIAVVSIGIYIHTQTHNNKKEASSEKDTHSSEPDIYSSPDSLPSDAYGMPTHWYPARGFPQGQHQPPCLQSLHLCFQYIHEITGVAPKLLSFVQQDSPQLPSHHSKTGEPFLAPNIVHYINFYSLFKYMYYLSYKTAHMHIKPSAIVLWGDNFRMDDENWARVRREIPNVYHVPTRDVSMLFGQRWWWVQHVSDALRIAVLRDFGGIYVDNDVIFLKSFDDFRVQEFTFGESTKGEQVANNVMVSAPNAQFLDVWLRDYESKYNHMIFAYNSCFGALKLAQEFSKLVHLEPGTFDNPNVHESTKFYAGRPDYDWERQYSTHLYRSKGHIMPESDEELKAYDCGYGDVMRLAVYGKKELRSEKPMKCALKKS